MRDYDQERRDQPEHRYSYDFDQVLRRYMIRTFLPWTRGGRAVELGCHDGDFTDLALPHFSDYTVVDASGESISRIRDRFGEGVRAIHSRFEDYVPDGRFRTAFLVHTLEHLDNPRDLLGRVRGWLDPGGRLIVATPNANAPSRQIAVRMGLIPHNTAVTEGERAHGHRVTYSLDTLERDAKAAGLRIAHRGGVFFKALANFQFDKLLGGDVISSGYLDGCYELGMCYPDLCATIFVVCEP